MSKYSNDMFLVNIDAFKTLMNEVISDRLDQFVEAQEPSTQPEFDIEDYRGDIETMISEYINYNVTVTIEG